MNETSATPVRIGDGERIVQMACGEEFCAAITGMNECRTMDVCSIASILSVLAASGALYTWGDRQCGCLGRVSNDGETAREDASTIERSQIVSIPDESKCKQAIKVRCDDCKLRVQVACGKNHCVLLAERSAKGETSWPVYTWGNASEGACQCVWLLAKLLSCRQTGFGDVDATASQ